MPTRSTKFPNAGGRRSGVGIITGALTGATVGVASRMPLGGVGAVISTLGGRTAQAKLAAASRQDRPAAFIEDAVIIGAALIVVGFAR